MRLLHTSDWHLGQTLIDFDRSVEHQHFLDWLLQTIGEQDADALLVAGDVFETANPAASAQKQLYSFLQQAKARYPQLDIVLVAGNHDSAARIDALSPLLNALGIRVIGHVPRTSDGEIDLTQLVIPLHKADGEVAAWCLALPFLRPSDVPQCTSTEDESTFDPFQAGVAQLYKLAFDHAQTQRQTHQATPSAAQAIIAMGHCHMTGGEISQDSERNIVLGGTDALSSKVFDPEIAYVALGHLHKAQRVAKTTHIRYSGSPLPMSFAEMDYRHQILCVELVGDKLSSVTEIPVPRRVELLRVPRQPAPLAEVLAMLASLQVDADLPLGEQPYLQVRVLLDAPEPGLRSQIEAALEGKAVRLAKIESTSKAQASGELVAVTLDDLQQLQPDEIFSRLYQQKFSQAVPDNLLAAFVQLQQAQLDSNVRVNA